MMHSMTDDTHSPSTAFSNRLRRHRPLLLDGGLGTQLEAMGQALHPTLWSAGLLHTAPDAIASAHQAYAEAGAEVLISASYQASRAGFRSIGLSDETADALLRQSVQLARRGAEAAGRSDCLVAASVGPWGATQQDGSEYTGHYAIKAKALELFHRERLEVLDDAGADVLACETLPNRAEAETLARLLHHTRTPAWVSFCCRDESCLSDGTAIEEAVDLFVDHPGVLALGVNCTAPRYVPALIARLRSRAAALPILVYPNSGEHYDAERQAWNGTIEPLDAGPAAQEWLKAGARGVGGCCRMGPDHIRAMAESARTPDQRTDTPNPRITFP